MALKPRDVVLIISAVIITTMCWWRLTTTPESKGNGNTLIQNQRTAIAFELYDQDSKRVSLEAYLHRHKIVLVFFDRANGPETNTTLKRLREVYPALKKSGVVAFAITNMLPQEVRKESAASFPFPILSDVLAGQEGSPSTLWGRAQTLGRAQTSASTDNDNARSKANGGPAPGSILPGTFYIDRTGLVAWDGEVPSPVPDADELINQLLSGQL